jgi:hypothetical protein
MKRSIATGGKMSLIGFSDSDYAADMDTRRSRSGSAWYFGGNLVSNQSKLQPSVILSTAEAEFCAITMNVTFALWAMQWIKEAGFEIREPAKLYSDSKSGLAIAQNANMNFNPSTGIDQILIRRPTVGVWGCRLAPKGRLNVIKGVCELVQIDKNVFKQVYMKKLDFGVREHSDSAATNSQIASAQEVCDPFQAASRPPHSVLFGDWILLRPACNPMRGRVQECLFPVLLRLRTFVSDARNGRKVAISLKLTTPWANRAKSRSTMSSLRGTSKNCPKWLSGNNLLIPYTFSTPPLS